MAATAEVLDSLRWAAGSGRKNACSSTSSVVVCDLGYLLQFRADIAAADIAAAAAVCRRIIKYQVPNYQVYR